MANRQSISNFKAIDICWNPSVLSNIELTVMRNRPHCEKSIHFEIRCKGSTKKAATEIVTAIIVQTMIFGNER